MGQYNKTTVTVVTGALATLAAAFAPADPEIYTAGQTLLSAILVWLWPNRMTRRSTL